MSDSAHEEVTVCLNQLNAGDTAAMDRLIPRIYDDLRQLAHGVFRGQSSDHTLQPTALVHEAYVRLVRPEKSNWQDRGHFYKAAAVAMRQLLTDHARARSADKRGGGVRPLTIEEDVALSKDGNGVPVQCLEEALLQLRKLNERQAQIVELRFFAGLTIDETAKALDVSPRTVKLDWTMAKAFLQLEIAKNADAES